MADPELHYKHRPNAKRHWDSFGNKPIIINSWGHHDNEFPVEKPAKQCRILNLGDSITMGHGVIRDETYSNQLNTDSIALTILYSLPGEASFVRLTEAFLVMMVGGLRI